MNKILILISLLIFLIYFPQKQEDYLKHGKKEMAKNNLNKAIDLFSKSINEKSNLQEAYFIRGLCFNLLKDYDNSIQDFIKSEDLGNNSEQLFTLRSYAYSQKKNNELALADVDKAISINPNFYPKNYFNKAMIEIRLQKYEASLNSLNSYIKNADNDANAYFERGKVLNILKKDSNKVCEDLKKSILLGNNSEELLNLSKKLCN
jgi:tetratricopeptide (TPR) repeat protein